MLPPLPVDTALCCGLFVAAWGASRTMTGGDSHVCRDASGRFAYCGDPRAELNFAAENEMGQLQGMLDRHMDTPSCVLVDGENVYRKVGEKNANRTEDIKKLKDKARIGTPLTVIWVHKSRRAGQACDLDLLNDLGLIPSTTDRLPTIMKLSVDARVPLPESERKNSRRSSRSLMPPKGERECEVRCNGREERHHEYCSYDDLTILMLSRILREKGGVRFRVLSLDKPLVRLCTNKRLKEKDLDVLEHLIRPLTCNDDGAPAYSMRFKLNLWSSNEDSRDDLTRFVESKAPSSEEDQGSGEESWVEEEEEDQDSGEDSWAEEDDASDSGRSTPVAWDEEEEEGHDEEPRAFTPTPDDWEDDA